MYSRGEVGVPFDLGEGAEHDEHVAGLFDGHLVLFGALAPAVDLAVGLGIGAEVVGGEGELPASAGGVLHEWAELGLEHLGALVEEEGAGGVDDVDGGDAPVAGVLLGEHEGPAVPVGDDLVAGHDLAVGEGGEGREVLPRPRRPPAGRASCSPRRSGRCRRARRWSGPSSGRYLRPWRPRGGGGGARSTRCRRCRRSSLVILPRWQHGGDDGVVVVGGAGHAGVVGIGGACRP